VAVSELRPRAPVVVSDNAAVRQESPQRRPSRGSFYARALVIDDSLSVRTQMNLCLEKLDITVEVAEDAQRGLDKLQERYYDLVFLDVMLPDMDGYQVCKLIKRDPRTQRVPVIMLTSKGSTINRIQGSIAGCNRYLIKPATERDVVKVVRDFIPGMPDHVSLNPV
jgi:two-component system, cell cycle response regulator